MKSLGVGAVVSGGVIFVMGSNGLAATRDMDLAYVVIGSIFALTGLILLAISTLNRK